LVAGGGEEFGAIRGAAVSEDGLDGDAVSLVEVEGLLESGQDAGDFFIWEEGGKGQAGMVVDGDVERLDAGAGIAVGTVAGGAHAGLMETAQFLDIQVQEFAGSSPFVANPRRLGRVECRQAMETVTAEDAGEGGFGDGECGEDLSVGAALAAESQDLFFEVRRSFAGLASRRGGVIVKELGEALGPGASEPFADGFFGDGEGACGGPERRAFREVMLDQFGSHERGESGISVHSVREVWQAVESVTTTHRPEPFRADNVLKHDT
jgi:hypothetical protein